MSKTKSSRSKLPLTLILPIILGLSAFVLLYTLINQEVINNEIVNRYLAGHTVSKVTTALFLIALASLAMIARDVVRQYGWLSRVSFGPSTPPQISDDSADPSQKTMEPSTTEQLKTRLEQFREPMSRSYLWRRLMTALNFIQRNGSADGLDDELKYAAESDAEEKDDRYSFVRIMIWAIPMLGFLGTVLGISEALGGIDVGENNNFQEMMGGLRASLYVAFDTTAIALTFAIVLMFLLFAVDRCETSLLARVDHDAREELAEHWTVTNQAKDSYVRTVEAIGASVLQSTESLVDRQIKLWRKNIEAAEAAWVESVKAAQEAVRANLREAITESTSQLGQNIAATIQRSDDAVSRRWEQWQVALSENARLLCSHQEQLVEHSKYMNGAVEQIGNLSETKKMFADYLQAIPDSSEFVRATERLSTAIRILEYRLAELKRQTPDSAIIAEQMDQAA